LYRKPDNPGPLPRRPKSTEKRRNQDKSSQSVVNFPAQQTQHLPKEQRASCVERKSKV